MDSNEEKECVTQHSTHMEKFIGSYILHEVKVKTILNFIKVTREPNINMHIESTSDLQKYWFEHDYSEIYLVKGRDSVIRVT